MLSQEKFEGPRNDTIMRYRTAAKDIAFSDRDSDDDIKINNHDQAYFKGGARRYSILDSLYD